MLTRFYRIRISWLYWKQDSVRIPTSWIMTRDQWWVWTGIGLDILQDACDFFGSGLDLDIHFWKKWIRTGSRYWFDFYIETFLRLIQDVINDGGSVFFAMVFILSVCAALIAINGNSSYLIVTFFRPGGNSKLLLYCCSAALLCWMAYVCVVQANSLFHGWQLVFDWDRLEDFLITRNWPVGNKVTNTI